MSTEMLQNYRPPNLSAEAMSAATAMPEVPGVSQRGSMEPLDAPGTMIAHFEVIRELGRGGMGRVVLARDTKLARLVALKFLSLQGGDLAQRFVVEARATARCQHENIVVIYEVDEWQGSPYMALEYLEGFSMKDALEAGTMSLAQTVEIMKKVCRALVRAHSFNMVHCDLKPDNILLTKDGSVKVLDFGIARISGGADQAAVAAISQDLVRGLGGVTIDDNTVCGTPPYMSFEQWGLGEIDHRTDIWAMGIIFWEALTSQHPLPNLTTESILASAVNIDEPLPSLASVAPHLPNDIVVAVDRCLNKRKDGRFASAAELLETLEALTPSRASKRNEDEVCPYPGLSAYQQEDADRFFGRQREVASVVGRLADHPLIALAGPSGVGKSSFLRAGLVPALKAASAWDVVIARPGRSPLLNLVTAVDALWRHDSKVGPMVADIDSIIERCKDEPGYLSGLIRAHAKRKQVRVLIFVDQFEELYTQGDDKERALFAAVLLGAADDVSSPIRVVMSIRSDFIDRAGEHPALLQRITNGVVFLQPLSHAGIADALTQPLAQVGYRFESDDLVRDMIGSLRNVSGALPLLQFAAASLWDRRDRSQRLLTRAAYDELGGIGGALANHAEGLVRALPSAQQSLLRSVMLRLVTPDGTRAIVARTDLEAIDDNVAALLDQMITARLLTTDVDGADAHVELIHESLVTHWPSLRRWRDDQSEDAAFLHELQPAARQWEQRDRAKGLLWAGSAAVDAQNFLDSFVGDLPKRERDFLEATIRESKRQQRRRKWMLVGGFSVLLGLVAAASVALIVVRGAQRDATSQRDTAQRETARATAAESAAKARLDEVQREQQLRLAADARRAEAEKATKQAETDKQATAVSLQTAETQVAQSQDELEKQNRKLKDTVRQAVAARQRADEATAKAEAAQVALAKKLEDERAENAKLKKAAGKLVGAGGLIR
jgi:eukaryotic-like serine/threonine-protein kinase